MLRWPFLILSSLITIVKITIILSRLFIRLNSFFQNTNCLLLFIQYFSFISFILMFSQVIRISLLLIMHSKGALNKTSSNETNYRWFIAKYVTDNYLLSKNIRFLSIIIIIHFYEILTACSEFFVNKLRLSSTRIAFPSQFLPPGPNLIKYIFLKLF